MTDCNITNNQSDIMTDYNITNNQSDRSNDSHSSKELFGLERQEMELSWSFWHKKSFARSVFVWTLSVVEIPIMLLTLYAMCFLIKSRRAASVFVIHLILSDLIQMICLILLTRDRTLMLLSAHGYSVTVGVYLMACVAFERYLLVSHPIWFKTHQTLKSSCLISLLIWFVPLIFATIRPPHLYFHYLWWSVATLIPYPVIILCFVGTWRGLSHAISLTSHKRRMILGTLFLVLLSYTFIILPISVVCFLIQITHYEFRRTLSFLKVYRFAECLLYLNPLADCLLYLFMRTDAADVLPSLHCCRRSDTHQISVRYTTRTTQPSS
ncbi:ovarian cancer G-protein coupled receptor 1-like [Triplophysa rosa]|uniref:ovarian cancer G-protein coupled receptor 1-like n=1 Tax=Triplophysa rosa TaxID=992332 RepID=UPI0025463366|nr:ovarian cancer G-protein coupled receptor 1-like [Triplophysa rosa]